jgi:hypothetical protein
MRRICRDIDRLTSASQLLRSTKNHIEFAFKQREGLLKIVTMSRRPAARGYVHIDQAKAACRALASEKDCVCVPDNPDMRRLPVRVRLCSVKLLCWPPFTPLSLFFIYFLFLCFYLLSSLINGQHGCGSYHGVFGLCLAKPSILLAEWRPISVAVATLPDQAPPNPVLGRGGSRSIQLGLKLIW